MRDIKFRGKNFYTGQWEFGDLETCPTADFCMIHKYKDSGTYDCQAWVVKNTVGQFTGLKDCNGKEIYEGDIIRTQFSERPFGVVWWSRLGYFYANNREVNNDNIIPLGWFMCKDIDGEPIKVKVIGNIHDNPELIKQIV